MLRIGAVVMNASNVERSGAFWSQALGYEGQPHNRAFLAPQHGEGPRLHLDENDRMHLDLWVDDEAEARAEVDRLVSIGAQRVDWEYPDDADFVVLSDPDGNLFCVIDISRSAP
jgi:catechol 2,3-dioxygenase-like lactoylglutathione lyase family enzyme